jgi:NADPH-dependent 2,4-dienoyl-CoA reductase/sulfur reductase-like enzyme
MRETELAVVGGGPAGLSAAIEAARAGVKVVLIDENSKPGGQLFKQIHKFFGSAEHYAGVRGIDIGTKLLAEVEASGAEVMLASVVWGLFAGRELGVIRERKNLRLKADRIILATGASENALAFPGWTLPGVMGAGAIQTLVNVHRVLPGRRVLMVGSGNVGLIVSYWCAGGGGAGGAAQGGWLRGARCEAAAERGTDPDADDGERSVGEREGGAGHLGGTG